MNNQDQSFAPPPVLPDEGQRRGQLLLRALPNSLIPLFTMIVLGVILYFTVGLPAPGEGLPNEPSPLVGIVVIVVFFTVLIMLVRFGRTGLSALLLVGVWTLMTTLLALRTGVTTIWPALLIIPICVAGLLIDGVASIDLAVLATLLIVSLTWLEMEGLSPRWTVPTPIEDLPAVSAALWVALFWTVAALTFLLASGLQRALTQSRLQAKALSELSAQLETRVATQTAELLAQEREAAMLEERTRVARDIHDTLAQGLTGVVVQLGAAQRALRVAPSEAEPHLDLAQRMAREALAEARRSVWNLRAPALERGTLCDALQGLVSHPLRPETIVTFEQRGESYALSPDVESALLRIGQEALVNVAKHADATRAQVVLEYAAESVHLSIRDNGVGFEESELTEQTAAPGPWGGFGLLGMRERLNALGGTLILTNEGGAQVQAMVPRPPQSTQDHVAIHSGGSP